MKRQAKKVKKIGRPPLPPEDRRDDFIDVRLSPRERAEIERRAKRAGLEPSTYMRTASLKTKIVGPPSVENMKAYTALKNTMSNLNQAVKAVNAGLDKMDRRAIQDLHDAIVDMGSELGLELVRRRR